VSARAAVASGAQDQNATNDTIVTTAAVILFWPAAFMIKGNGANAQEVAQLKGDKDAIEQANVQKNATSNSIAPLPRAEPTPPRVIPR
jgi:hypothetical protein